MCDSVCEQRTSGLTQSRSEQAPVRRTTIGSTSDPTVRLSRYVPGTHTTRLRRRTAAIPHGPRTCTPLGGLAERRPNWPLFHRPPHRSSRWCPSTHRAPCAGRAPSGRHARPPATGTVRCCRVVDHRMRNESAHRARSRSVLLKLPSGSMDISILCDRHMLYALPCFELSWAQVAER